MMKKSVHWFFLFISALIFGCNGNGLDPDPNGNLAEARKVLAFHTANEIILPAFENLKLHTDSLAMANESFVLSVDETQLAHYQESLKKLWLVWQSAAPFLFGPSESNTLPSAMATYPTDTAKIESNIMDGTYNLGSLTNTAAIGLPALDYLLNGQNVAAILEDFSTDSQAEKRKTYATELVAALQSKVDASLEGWKSGGGNYVGTFTAESAAGTDVGSALGLLVNAMDLHFQRFVRDGKIAIPAGVRSAGVPRPLTVEALYGQYSVEILLASLDVYSNLYLGIAADGTDGKGLYDYLLDLEADVLAEDLKNQIVQTRTVAASLTDPLDAQIDADLEAVNAVFLEMQKIVVLIKSDMASAMGIAITNQDNDGD